MARYARLPSVILLLLFRAVLCAQHHNPEYEQAVAAVRTLGGILSREDTGPAGAGTVVYLRATPVSDADLAHLKGLADLRVLNLAYTSVTDAGLERLRHLTSL